MKHLRQLILSIASTVLFATLPVLAETQQELDAIQKVIAAKLLKVDSRYLISGSIKPSGLENFYVVQLENGPKLYVTKNGDNFFEGNLYSIAQGKIDNLTEKDASIERLALMKEFKPAEMIVFSPKLPVKTKARINVFTDIDCGYCRKLHSEVGELNSRGIEVRYLAFPRAGIPSESNDKIVTAWCSQNKQEALTKLKNNEKVETKNCNNPVAKQYELGKRMGVTGTPAIILEDGTLIPGYRPAAEMAKQLGI